MGGAETFATKGFGLPGLIQAGIALAYARTSSGLRDAAALAGASSAAGQAELRVAWARRMFSALQVARMYGSSPATDEVMAVSST